MCRCAHTLAWRDAQPQRVASPPQDLGQVSVLEVPNLTALHRLQLVAGLNLTAASRRAAAAHRHKAVGHQGGACRKRGGVTSYSLMKLPSEKVEGHKGFATKCVKEQVSGINQPVSAHTG